MTQAKYIKQFQFIWSCLQWVTFSFTSVHRLVWRNPSGDIFWGWFKTQGSLTRSAPAGVVLKRLSYIVRSSRGKVFKHFCFFKNENWMHSWLTMSTIHSLCIWETLSDRYVSTTVENYWSSRRVTEEEISQMCWFLICNLAEHPHKLICSPP